MKNTDNKNKVFLFNTLSKRKELFKPITPDHVGLYVCGPTVYGEPHLGHARPAVTFDVVFRYFTHIGYKVRYVRNITDVGHLEHDAIAKKARLEQLEPMEVAQYYMDSYHKAMDALNVKGPSIEPRASDHIIEQIEMVQKILDKGYAYVSEGSVYFDVEKFDKDFGGGMDLLFPHHESEVCQSTVANGKSSVKYWMHNNMITIEGQKMGK